jgi:hypothetical protein
MQAQQQSGGYTRLKVLSDLWNQQAQRPKDKVIIAESECAMVPLTLWHARHEIRGSRVLWLVDNSPSLHSLVKGASGNPAMDRAVAVTYVLCYLLDCTIYFEYVDSLSNFSDGISRELEGDTWAAAHDIPTKVMENWPSWWTTPLPALWDLLQEQLDAELLDAQTSI